MISEHFLLAEIRRSPASFAEICRRNGLVSTRDRTKFRTILNRLKSKGVIAIVTHEGRAFPSGGNPFLYITTEPETFAAALQAGAALGFDVEVDSAPPEYQSVETQAILRGVSAEGEPEPAFAPVLWKPLSPEEWHSLDDLGRHYGLSEPEVIERMRRGIASGTFQCIDLLGRPTRPDREARIGVVGLEPTVFVTPPSERTGEVTFAFLEFIKALRNEVVAIRDLPEKLGASIEAAHEFLCFAVRGERVLLGASSPPRPNDLVSLSKSRHVPFLIAADLREILVGDAAFKIHEVARDRRCSDDKVISAARILAYQSVPALATCFEGDLRPLWASEVGSETIIRPGDFRPPIKTSVDPKFSVPRKTERPRSSVRPTWPPPISAAAIDRAGEQRRSNAPVSPFLRELTNLLQPDGKPSSEALQPPYAREKHTVSRGANERRSSGDQEAPHLDVPVDHMRETRPIAKSGGQPLSFTEADAASALRKQPVTRETDLPELLREPLTIEQLVLRSGKRRSDVVASLEALSASGDLGLANQHPPHRYSLGPSVPTDNPEALTTADALVVERAIDDDRAAPPGKALKRIEAALWFPRDLNALSVEVRMPPDEVRKVLARAIGRTILATGTPGGRDEKFSAGPQVKQKLASPEVLSLAAAVYQRTTDDPVLQIELSAQFDELAQLLPFAIARLTGLELLVQVGDALRRPILVGAISDFCWIPRTRDALDIEFPHIGDAAISKAIEMGVIHQVGEKYLAGSR